jgi:hypothetical protein
MDSKIKTLSQITGYTEPELSKRKSEPILQPHDCLQSLNIHARNVAVELIQWLNPGYYRMGAEKVVNDFLQSDYLKERTEG